MAKVPAPAPSPERMALVHAHEARVVAQAALAEAEATHSMAVRDLHGTQLVVDEIADEIRRLKSRRTHGLPNLLEQVNAELAIAYSKHDTATRAVAPFGTAAMEAKARVDAANWPAANAQTRVAQAAVAVVSGEAEPIARASLAQLREAFAVILHVGPDLLTMLDKQIAPPDVAREAESVAGGLLQGADGLARIHRAVPVIPLAHRAAAAGGGSASPLAPGRRVLNAFQPAIVLTSVLSFT